MQNRATLAALCWAAAACGEDAEISLPQEAPPDCVAGLGQVPVPGCEAGIPPESCGAGFEGDGTMGCRALLPEEACAAGTLAIPGETSCRELVPCGSGKWGNAPLSPSTIFVDARYAALDSDGTETKPFKTISAGVAATSRAMKVSP